MGHPSSVQVSLLQFITAWNLADLSEKHQKALFKAHDKTPKEKLNLRISFVCSLSVDAGPYKRIEKVVWGGKKPKQYSPLIVDHILKLTKEQWEEIDHEGAYKKEIKKIQRCLKVIGYGPNDGPIMTFL